MQEVKFWDLMKGAGFWSVHAACFLVIWSGTSPIAVSICIALYLIRMFAITAGYHRYFSHRTYKTSRVFQFLLAFVGASSAQKGPMWWASHHRHHHKHSDTEEDIHPPSQGLWWAHVGWVTSAQFIKPRLELVKDLQKYPEIRLVDKFHLIPPLLLATSLYFFGSWCQKVYPASHTSGFQMLVWGFFISTTFLYHGTFIINSLTHLIGTQRFETGDRSRNNWFLALITLGEGWHNNHHRYPGSERQGFYWWEIDVSHYVLKILSWFGIVWDLRTPPPRIYEEARKNRLNLSNA